MVHLWQRPDRDGMWYLVDGRTCKSLKTRKKGLAEERLKAYLRSEIQPNGSMTVGAYYEKWIATKREPIVRRRWLVNAQHTFNCYILPEFRTARFQSVTIERMENFQTALLKRLSIKTVANIFAYFRTMWKVAIKQGATSRSEEHTSELQSRL